jgi:hypothetical protein
VSVETPEKPQSPQEARKQAKAELAAAKARAKAARPFWKKPLVWIASLVVILIVAVALGGGGNETKTAAPAGIGEPAADGQFTFTVNGFECGAKKLGRAPLVAKAQGQFCIAETTVKNTGDKAAVLDAGSQYAYIGDKQYSASSDVLMADTRAEAFFIKNINPGNGVEGVVVWDVPAGQTPDALEFHDSPFSAGVKVEL